jgi:NAD(P)-dependent dehydrogenase (short-subunit alcohol dehydrogenase family)
MSVPLPGRMVVVTGAASGIGRETALLAARRGARLALCDVDEDGLGRTARDARALGADVLSARVDVARPEDHAAFAAQVHAVADAADVLINNAGIAVIGGFLDTEPEDWERLVQVNLMGVVHGCRAFVPAMVARGTGGHVANVSSQAGFQASPGLIAYSTVKFGVFGFSEALRGDLAPHGIGVTAVCPGVIDTPITRNSVVRGANAPERQARFARVYARRGYTPDKVAAQLLRAVERNRAVAPIAPEAHGAYWMSRLAPGLSRWAAAKTAGLLS